MFCKTSSAFYLFSKIQQISYSYNSAKIDKDIAQLIDDDEIKKTKGIWQYELAINSEETGATKYLNLRGFPKDMMRKKLKEQEYHCPLCIEEGNDKTYTLSEMEGDHITPWSEGGKTEYDICKCYVSVIIA